MASRGRKSAPPVRPRKSEGPPSELNQGLQNTGGQTPEIQKILLDMHTFLQDLRQDHLQPEKESRREKLLENIAKLMNVPTTKNNQKIKQIVQVTKTNPKAVENFEEEESYETPESPKLSPQITKEKPVIVFDEDLDTYDDTEIKPKHEEVEADDNYDDIDNQQETVIEEDDTYAEVENQDPNEILPEAQFEGNSAKILNSQSDHKGWLVRKEGYFKTSKYWALIYKNQVYIYDDHKDEEANEILDLKLAKIKAHKKGLMFVLTVKGDKKEKNHQLSTEVASQTTGWVTALQLAIKTASDAPAGNRLAVQSKTKERKGSVPDFEIEEEDQYESIDDETPIIQKSKEPDEEIIEEEEYDDIEDNIPQTPRINSKPISPPTKSKMEPVQKKPAPKNPPPNLPQPPKVSPKPTPPPTQIDTHRDSSSIGSFEDDEEEKKVEEKNTLQSMASDDSFEYDDTDVPDEGPESKEIEETIASAAANLKPKPYTKTFQPSPPNNPMKEPKVLFPRGQSPTVQPKPSPSPPFGKPKGPPSAKAPASIAYKFTSNYTEDRPKTPPFQVKTNKSATQVNPRFPPSRSPMNQDRNIVSVPTRAKKPPQEEDFGSELTSALARRRTMTSESAASSPFNEKMNMFRQSEKPPVPAKGMYREETQPRFASVLSQRK